MLINFKENEIIYKFLILVPFFVSTIHAQTLECFVYNKCQLIGMCQVIQKYSQMTLVKTTFVIYFWHTTSKKCHEKVPLQ